MAIDEITLDPHPLGQGRQPLAIRVSRNARARRMSLTVRSCGEVRLTLPRHAGLAHGTAFARAQTGWLAMKLAESESRVARAPKENINEGEAVAFLTGRTEELSVELGLPIKGITVRRQRTRWGSCTARNHVNLNIRLAGLPSHLVDYVIIHELVHTKVKNHGPEFWKTLDHYLPGAPALRDLLKSYSAE